MNEVVISRVAVKCLRCAKHCFRRSVCIISSDALHKPLADGTEINRGTENEATGKPVKILTNYEFVGASSLADGKCRGKYDALRC